MTTFLLQRQDKRIVHDFVFALLQSKAYYDWSQNYGSIKTRFVDGENPVPTLSNPDGYVPVGDHEFVSRFLRRYYPEAEAALRPLNVPECLFGYAGRKIVNVQDAADMKAFGPAGGEGLHCRQLFRKSLSIIKAGTNGPCDYGSAKVFVGHQVSEIIPIDSEWRVFVFHNQIRYVANYSGDCMIFPDAEAVSAMVAKFRPEAPVAYTLDVGVNSQGAFVVECHRFFSCGLYGFNDLLALPVMLSQTWYQMKNTR